MHTNKYRNVDIRPTTTLLKSELVQQRSLRKNFEIQEASAVSKLLKRLMDISKLLNSLVPITGFLQ